MKVAICTPVHSHPSFFYMTSLAGLLLYTPKNRPDIELGCNFQRGAGIERNRRLLAEAALSRGADWLLWIDADQQFPAETLTRLLSHGKPIVGCNIARRSDDQPPTARGLDGATVDCSGPGIAEVATTGFGVMLTAADVFTCLAKPWFRLTEELGEDERFCLNARKAGYSVYVDHDLSRHIGHIGEKIYTL